jgi:hypothetical protein
MWSRKAGAGNLLLLLLPGVLLVHGRTADTGVTGPFPSSSGGGGRRRRM